MRQVSAGAVGADEGLEKVNGGGVVVKEAGVVVRAAAVTPQQLPVLLLGKLWFISNCVLHCTVGRWHGATLAKRRISHAAGRRKKKREYSVSK